jgi:uncharacterized protein (DUF302 family)
MAKDPEYGHTVHMQGVPFETARTRTIDALKEQGFGVLTEIDVKSTMKAKLDRDFRRYVILGACNPQLAWRALNSELPVGLLLPCNVCVWEDEGGSVVSAVRPKSMFSVVDDNPDLEPVAAEADQRLQRALEQLKK